MIDKLKTTYLFKFLDMASKRYHEGVPVISDEQFDYLAETCGYNTVGEKVSGKTDRHMYPMYSLQKYYPGEGKTPLLDYTKPKITTPKLDGAAVSLLYVKGLLTLALTRGDGVEGEVVTDKFIRSPMVPNVIESSQEVLQVIGEVVASKEIKNSRNYASGALKLLDLSEFDTRELHFVAYGLEPCSGFYDLDLNVLHNLGFKTVKDEEFCSQFPQDGVVVRVNSNLDYKDLGYTSSHPRGAYAIKERKQGVETVLRSVEWQTGKSGRVTPVGIFDPVNIDGAVITKATLNNPAYIKALDLDIGDKIIVVRSGDIIPTIVGKPE